MSEKFKSIKNFVKSCENNALNAQEVCDWALNNDTCFVWHPLGFVMATLIDEGENKIRLHLWPNSFQNAQKPTWLIHDHLFDLVSWVLSGSIENIEYKKRTSPFSHQLYSVSYEAGGSKLTKLNSFVSLEVDKKHSINERESYIIKSGILHQSISISSNTTVTVCHSRNVREESPLVVGELDGEATYQYNRSTVKPSDLAVIIAEI
jgi:hypothetical protein